MLGSTHSAPAAAHSGGPGRARSGVVPLWLAEVGTAPTRAHSSPVPAQSLLAVKLAIGVEHRAETFAAVRFQVEGFLAGVAERDEQPGRGGLERLRGECP